MAKCSEGARSLASAEHTLTGSISNGVCAVLVKQNYATSSQDLVSVHTEQVFERLPCF